MTPTTRSATAHGSAELTNLLNLRGWPKGMRVIARKERPHPGAQLTITDIDGHRDHGVRHGHPHRWPGTQLADLELRHRHRARCEDRIRIAKDIHDGRARGRDSAKD